MSRYITMNIHIRVLHFMFWYIGSNHTTFLKENENTLNPIANSRKFEDTQDTIIF